VRRIRVDLGARGYDVLVGDGAIASVGDLLPPGTRRVAVVTQEGVPADVELPVDSFRVTVPAGEQAKSLHQVEEVCRRFARGGLTRADAVLGVGGGVVTDLAGFAAAVYHRGTPVVQVPTTLLAQVDAAIGGKTGVNLPEGKNLVGAFWQPRGVCCDTALLSTLPAAEWRSGRGEMVKYVLLGAGPLDGLTLAEQVARCVALKAAVVAADERDADRRMVLNYGHTLGHALEAGGFAEVDAPARSGWAGGRASLRHGEAVAIGLVFAALLARRLGRIDDDRVEEHRVLVRAESLPAALPAGADPAALLDLMQRDKKVSGGLTFVLDGPSGVEVVRDVPRHAVLAALSEMEVDDG
jgi:5-deoxy-5-amino-3-dehydroquinate synthase